MTEAEKIYERFVHYEWNSVSNSLKESILEAINEALILDKKGGSIKYLTIIMNN